MASCARVGRERRAFLLTKGAHGARWKGKQKIGQSGKFGHHHRQLFLSLEIGRVPVMMNAEVPTVGRHYTNLSQKVKKPG